MKKKSDSLRQSQNNSVLHDMISSKKWMLYRFRLLNSRYKDLEGSFNCTSTPLLCLLLQHKADFATIEMTTRVMKVSWARNLCSKGGERVERE